MSACTCTTPEGEAMVAAIMATPHTLAMTTAEGELQPWVLSEHHVRDLVDHGKGAAVLARCQAWVPSGCPSCGRDIDKLGGNPECQSCAAEPAGEEA